MKKKILLGMTMVLVIGSIKAMAFNEEDAMNLNQMSKIEAVEMDQNNISDADGKIMAVQIRQIEVVRQDIEDLINQMGAAGTGLQAHSLGQMSYLAETYEARSKTTDSSAEVNQIWQDAMKLKEQVAKIKGERK